MESSSRMKIIVADKISERGFAMLREAGWEVVTPAAAELPGDLATPTGLSCEARRK